MDKKGNKTYITCKQTKFGAAVN